MNFEDLSEELNKRLGWKPGQRPKWETLDSEVFDDAILGLQEIAKTAILALYSASMYRKKDCQNLFSHFRVIPVLHGGSRFIQDLTEDFIRSSKLGEKLPLDLSHTKKNSKEATEMLAWLYSDVEEFRFWGKAGIEDPKAEFENSGHWYSSQTAKKLLKLCGDIPEYSPESYAEWAECMAACYLAEPKTDIPDFYIRIRNEFEKRMAEYVERERSKRQESAIKDLRKEFNLDKRRFSQLHQTEKDQYQKKLKKISGLPANDEDFEKGLVKYITERLKPLTRNKASVTKG